MSMHCALAGIPGAVTYKTDPLTYWLGRMIVTVEYIGIANLLLKRAMYRELIQGEASADNLAAELQGALTDKDRVAQIQSDAEELRSLLSSSADLTTATWMANQLRA
jgi:lipid-A-disaccharide synthase